MNGALDRVKRIAGRAHPASLRHLLAGIAIPALAAAGTLGVVAVLVGLQCGGLDRCFVRPSQPVTVVTPPAEAPAPVEPRLAADHVAAAEPAPVTAVDARTKQIDTMIVGSFDAIRADDAGWLSGAHSAKVEEAVAVVEEGDGPGPHVEEPATPTPKTRVAAARSTGDGDAAVAAIAALEQPVKPVPRPEPLTVTAFADAPKDTAAEVTAAAKKQLAAVAEKTPVAEAKAAPAPVQPTQVADIAAGATRTIGGSGVNVRSGPGKSTAKLFALAGGEKVKVGENQRGWLKITDDQGRTGWVYKTYLD